MELVFFSTISEEKWKKKDLAVHKLVTNRAEDDMFFYICFFKVVLVMCLSDLGCERRVIITLVRASGLSATGEMNFRKSTLTQARD